MDACFSLGTSNVSFFHKLETCFNLKGWEIGLTSRTRINEYVFTLCRALNSGESVLNKILAFVQWNDARQWQDLPLLWSAMQ
jgi:hypothetical protein